MITKIYLARNNVQAGPYTLEQINVMLASGEVLLDDLMWHKGMTHWQTVGEVTGGRLVYSPNSPNHPTSPPAQRGFGDNVELYPHDKSTTSRPSVDRLYGRQPVFKQTPQTKTTPSSANTGIKYATIGQRFLAFGINTALYLLAILPLLVAMLSLFDANVLGQSATMGELVAYSNKLASQIPTSTLNISHTMLFALLGMQLLLIFKRGQSFGKMVMGIRVVNQNTQKIPDLFTLLFVRTIFLIFIYSVGLLLFSGLPSLCMLSVNYIMANRSPSKQGWHDNLAKTIVVQANPNQLDKNT